MAITAIKDMTVADVDIWAKSLSLPPVIINELKHIRGRILEHMVTLIDPGTVGISKFLFCAFKCEVQNLIVNGCDMDLARAEALKYNAIEQPAAPMADKETVTPVGVTPCISGMIDAHPRRLSFASPSSRSTAKKAPIITVC